MKLETPKKVEIKNASLNNMNYVCFEFENRKVIYLNDKKTLRNLAYKKELNKIQTIIGAN